MMDSTILESGSSDFCKRYSGEVSLRIDFLTLFGAQGRGVVEFVDTVTDRMAHSTSCRLFDSGSLLEFLTQSREIHVVHRE